MTVAEKAVEIACSQNGQKETPPGSNRGPMVDVYLRSVGLDPTKGQYAWCAALVSWSVYGATKIVGGPPMFKGSAGALDLYHINKGLWIPGPIENCVGVEDHGGGKGHAFFVIAPEGGSWDSMQTFSGNTDVKGGRTGGQAMFGIRERSKTFGFFRIG